MFACVYYKKDVDFLMFWMVCACRGDDWSRFIWCFGVVKAEKADESVMKGFEGI
jgi:hypothetical protein